MLLASKIADYNLHWKQQVKAEAIRLGPVFNASLVVIQHVGSTSVVGLLAKPEMDTLIVTEARALDMECPPNLSASGYKRGKDLSVGDQLYKRDEAGVRAHKLHMCIVGQEKTWLMLDSGDVLQSNDPLREEYGALKLYLESMNTSGIGGYLVKKGPFINSVLQSVGVR